jgi:hypothetical protein
MILISNFGDAMFYGSEVQKGIKPNSLVKYLIPKSQFLDIDEKEVDNVNKDGQKVNKHTKL